MKYALIFFVIVLTSYAPLRSQPLSTSARAKEQLAKIIQDVRGQSKWTLADACPADFMPQTGRRPTNILSECSNAPERCFLRCGANDADACHAFARVLQDHGTIATELAEVFYQRSCELGVVSGCTNRAANILERNELKHDRCAARTFAKTCSQNDPWGCTMFGLVTSAGIGMTKNLTKADNSLTKACKISVDKNGEACVKAMALKAALKRNKVGKK